MLTTDDLKILAGDWFNYGSATISWSSKRQTCVATASTEAELHALSAATKEALHLQAILETLGRPASATLKRDSQSQSKLHLLFAADPDTRNIQAFNRGKNMTSEPKFNY